MDTDKKNQSDVVNGPGENWEKFIPKKKSKEKNTSDRDRNNAKK